MTPENQGGVADKEDVWTIGSKFKPSTNGSTEEAPNRFGSTRVKGDMGPPKEPLNDEGDWRSSARTKQPARTSISRELLLLCRLVSSH